MSVGLLHVAFETEIQQRINFTMCVMMMNQGP